MTDAEITKLVANCKGMQGKLQKQRNEIARLNQKVEALQKANRDLLKDIKWMRGEK
jgi:peptidoglycan hydrolase CwlO-like protein